MLLTLIIMASVIVIGAVMLLDIAPLQFIADFLARTTQPDPTPSATPLSVPLAVEGVAAVTPYYPPLKITVPSESVFTESTIVTSVTESRSRLVRGFVGNGSCLMNDGTRMSLLPDCVVGSGVGAQASQ